MKQADFGIAGEEPARAPRMPAAASPQPSGTSRAGVCAAPPQAGEYRCVVVDPPWDQGKTGRRVCRPNQGTELDYPTLSAADILRTAPVGEWAGPQSLIWLWATNSKSRSSGRPVLVHAFELLERWGFEYYTLVTWNKQTGPCPFGPYQITTEHCLFGYRGKFDTPEELRGQLKTCFDARATGHSRKPRAFYEFIAAHFAGPRLDVFARKPHDGFDGWGNEYESGG